MPAAQSAALPCDPPLTRRSRALDPYAVSARAAERIRGWAEALMREYAVRAYGRSGRRSRCAPPTSRPPCAKWPASPGRREPSGFGCSTMTGARSLEDKKAVAPPDEGRATLVQAPFSIVREAEADRESRLTAKHSVSPIRPPSTRRARMRARSPRPPNVIHFFVRIANVPASANGSTRFRPTRFRRNSIRAAVLVLVCRH
jgi:hypothetical protein